MSNPSYVVTPSLSDSEGEDAATGRAAVDPIAQQRLRRPLSVVSFDVSLDRPGQATAIVDGDDGEDGECGQSVTTALSSITDGRMPRKRGVPALRYQPRFVSERPLTEGDDDDDDEIKSYQDTDSRFSRPAGQI